MNKIKLIEDLKNRIEVCDNTMSLINSKDQSKINISDLCKKQNAKALKSSLESINDLIISGFYD